MLVPWHWRVYIRRDISHSVKANISSSSSPENDAILSQRKAEVVFTVHTGLALSHSERAYPAEDLGLDYWSRH